MEFGNGAAGVDRVPEADAREEQDLEANANAFLQAPVHLGARPATFAQQPSGSAISLSDMDLSEGMEEDRVEKTVARNVGR